MEQFTQLKNEQDYLDFASRTNGLHDGHIISADYRKSVRIVECNHYVHHMPDLTLKILVTSMKDHPVVELKFSGVRDMRLYGGFSDIFGFTMKWGTMNNLLHEPYVQWCTEFEFDWENHSMETNPNTTYVIACDAEWRFTGEYYDADNAKEIQ